MAAYRIPGATCFTTCAPIDDGTMCRSASPLPGSIAGRSASFNTDGNDQGDDGLEIVLTPMQLSAIFNCESMGGEASSMQERLLGAATLVGGALELVGAAALLVTPEPTSMTKLAGVALGAHGLDTASTGMAQLFTGHVKSTRTAEAAQSVAQELGIDERNAKLIGLTLDIGIPLIFGFAGVARVILIRRGAISLATEEAAGGHTIARHVGRTEAQLRTRLAAKSRIRAATSFYNLSDAERAIAGALRGHQAEIKAWAKVAATDETKTFAYDAGRFVGFGVVRGTNSVQHMTRLMVVIKKIQADGKLYYLLTSYPIL